MGKVYCKNMAAEEILKIAEQRAVELNKIREQISVLKLELKVKKQQELLLAAKLRSVLHWID